MNGEVLCVGELLWDSLPRGLFLGGAPLNVAGHLNALGVPATILSRVGTDRLGEEAVRRVERYGIPTDLIQVDPTRSTGFVAVELDDDGIPAYDILAPAAWDAIEIGASVIERARGARAVVYGSLAQRSPVTRECIARLRELEVLRVFDVNLRPPYDIPEIVRDSLRSANIVKLNAQELQRVASWFGLPPAVRDAARAVAETFGCATVCVTRGAEGATLCREGRWTEHPGFRVDVADTVGSGDAFLAALLRGILTGESDEHVLRQANLLGAFVASRPGAVPEHDATAIEKLRGREIASVMTR